MNLPSNMYICMKAMKRSYIFLLLSLITFTAFSQEDHAIKGKVLNDANDVALENVNIVNLNSVKGTTTDSEGDFEIRAAVNDTLYCFGRSCCSSGATYGLC